MAEDTEIKAKRPGKDGKGALPVFCDRLSANREIAGPNL